MEKLSQKCIENVYRLVEKNKMKLQTCVDYLHCIIITFLTKAVIFPCELCHISIAVYHYLLKFQQFLIATLFIIMSSKNITFSEKRSNGNVQECWTYQYGVIERNSKALCILCKEQVVSRTWNVKRHCETDQMWLLQKNEEERKEYITLELTKTNAQSKDLLRFASGNSDLVSASFSLSYSIVNHGKPFSDGEFLKSAFMDCAHFLFDDF